MVAAMCDSGARSPEAPTEPWHGNHRRQALHEHGFQQVGRRRLHARGALRQAGQLQGHHQPDHRNRRGRARPGGVRQDDVALQGLQVRVADAYAGQLPKARIDAVDRRALGQDALDGRGAFGDHRRGAFVQPCGRAAIDGLPVGQADFTGVEDDFDHATGPSRRAHGAG
jgi:hypothetical protein